MSLEQLMPVTSTMFAVRPSAAKPQRPRLKLVMHAANALRLGQLITLGSF